MRTEIEHDYLRPNVVSLYSRRPRRDGLSVSRSIARLISQLSSRSATAAGKSFPIRIGQATERLCGGGQNSRAPKVAIVESQRLPAAIHRAGNTPHDPEPPSISTRGSWFRNRISSSTRNPRLAKEMP